MDKNNVFFNKKQPHVEKVDMTKTQHVVLFLMVVIIRTKSS